MEYEDKKNYDDVAFVCHLVCGIRRPLLRPSKVGGPQIHPSSPHPREDPNFSVLAVYLLHSESSLPEPVVLPLAPLDAKPSSSPVVGDAASSIAVADGL